MWLDELSICIIWYFKVSFIEIRDLKPSNILLGDDMKAKVADFRLVRLAPDGKCCSIETRLAGTFGNLAPEYARHLMKQGDDLQWKNGLKHVLFIVFTVCIMLYYRLVRFEGMRI